MKTLLILALAATPLSAAPAAAQNIGDQFRCPGPEGLPDVLATIGRTDMLSELLGEAVTPDQMILHLQLVGDGADLPLVPHAPFDQAAVAGCDQLTVSVPFDRTAFMAGFDAYRADVRTDDAGFFQIPPAEAFWLTIGELSDGG